MTLSLVIPAWNEPVAIGPLLDEIPHHLVQGVLVVVGAPDDPTADVARAHAARVDVLVQIRAGYGAACWTGAQAALAKGADAVCFLDGDYADPPAALPVLLERLRAGADLVLGCRDLRRHPDALPVHARAGNSVVRWLIRVLVGRSYRDLPSLKLIRADALRRLAMQEMTYGWTVELLVKAARAGLRIDEVDVAYRPRLGGRSKVAGSLGGSLRAAWSLARCSLAYATWRPALTDAQPAPVPAASAK